jgi:flagellar protein FlgJ
MAKEFEATFLSMLLKEMRQTLDPDGGLFPGDGGDVQGGMFDMFMGSHLADAGGVGLADALVRQLRSSAYAPPPDRPAAGPAAG